MATRLEVNGTITIEIGDTVVNLSLTEAKQLQNKLNEIFPDCGYVQPIVTYSHSQITTGDNA